MEQTFIMLKPDAYEKQIYGKIIQVIEESGLVIKNIKMMKLNKALIANHYAQLTHLSFYPELESFMLSGPVLAMIVEGENAISKMRELMGPTKFDPVKSVGTIRGNFADKISIERNVMHGSDSPEAAKAEIMRFFGENTTL